MVDIIVGANWGDEGKGKIVDLLSSNYDMVIRFQGGSNAGHTIINSFGKFALHLLPSGIFHDNVLNVISNGVVVNAIDFKNELEAIKNKTNINPNIAISDRAQLVMSYHINTDKYEEERLGDKSFGSTKSGIAPSFSDKYSKIGFQISDLFRNEKELILKVENVCQQKNILFKYLYNKPTINSSDIVKELLYYKKILSPYVVDAFELVENYTKMGKKILLEGQLGALRDPDHGIYPMSTSSSTIAGYATVGAGINVNSINNIISVVKSYSTQVGSGAFVTEIFDEEANELRNRGGSSGEYGAKTGRPRRMGWFDIVATKYGCNLQSSTQIALTMIDCLTGFKKIPICTHYIYKGDLITYFPTTNILEKCKPYYIYLDGWNQNIQGIKNYSDLPINCQKYIEFLEKSLEIPITIISTGPNREDIIYRNN